MCDEIFAEDRHLALRIVLAIYFDLWTVRLLMFYELAPRHLLLTLLAFEQHKLTVRLQMVFESDSYYLFYAVLTNLDAIQAVGAVLWHVLAGYPSLTAWVQAHDQFKTTGFLMIGEHAIFDFFKTSVSIVGASHEKKVFELVFERYRNLEELDAYTPKWTLLITLLTRILSRNSYSLAARPSIDTDPAEHIPALATFERIPE